MSTAGVATMPVALDDAAPEDFPSLGESAAIDESFFFFSTVA